MHIRVLQNATKVELDLWFIILVLDLVNRSQKALTKVSRWDINMGTFALKF